MSEPPRLHSKQSVIDVLRRAGIDRDTLEQIDAELDDPVDLATCRAVMDRHGLNVQSLMDRLGASP
jgi:hypothetical protein